MRLLHLETLELTDFFNEEVPPYAILSHRWGKNEVSFKDMRKKRDLETHPGMAKIIGFRAFAQSRQKYTPVKWGWVDTCCIDKSSSAELSEAINSMFLWYMKSAYCCAYLADVPNDDPSGRAFEDSEWFRRGWTLQELLAPTTVIFCDASWTIIGHKCRWRGDYCHERRSICRAGLRLNERIVQATDIHPKYLEDAQAYTTASVACRMSWASRRETTRTEDIAYCLLGIFDVHLPPLYGEGTNAFRRLQEEIVRRSNDQSIFAWFNLERWLTTFGMTTWDSLATPMIARHPMDFGLSGSVVASGVDPGSPYYITNNGLELRADVQHHKIGRSDDVVLSTYLNCSGGPPLPPELSQKESSYTCIALIRVGKGPHDLMRLHFRPGVSQGQLRLKDKGQSKKLLYVKTAGTPYRFQLDRDEWFRLPNPAWQLLS